MKTQKALFRYKYVLRSLSICFILMLLPAKEVMAMKLIRTGVFSISMIRLLSNRVALKDYKVGKLPDIPGFMGEANICAKGELNKIRNVGAYNCVAAVVVYSRLRKKEPIVELKFTPDVNASAVLNNMKKVLANRTLGEYAVDENVFKTEMKNMVDHFIKEYRRDKNDMVMPYRALIEFGYTYPMLEHLFQFVDPQYPETVTKMYTIISGPYTTSIDSAGITTFTFKPSHKLFDN